MNVTVYDDGIVSLRHGDVIEALRELDEASVDSICTDPPYGLEFMGRDWDRFGRNTGNGYQEKPRMNDSAGLGGYQTRPNYYTAGSPYQAWCQEWAEECLRVLKPGGHLLAFGANCGGWLKPHSGRPLEAVDGVVSASRRNIHPT